VSRTLLKLCWRIFHFEREDRWFRVKKSNDSWRKRGMIPLLSADDFFRDSMVGSAGEPIARSFVGHENELHAKVLGVALEGPLPPCPVAASLEQPWSPEKGETCCKVAKHPQ